MKITDNGQLEAYAALGWKLVPINSETRHPPYNGWQNTTFPLDKILADMDRGREVGIQVGPVSNWLCAADLDSHYARVCAPDHLPDTLKSGKVAEELPSHYLYYAEGADFFTVKPLNPKSEKGEVLCLKAAARGQGHQIIVPPSTHPTKGRYVWHGGWNPEKIVKLSAEDLERRLRNLAASALIAEHLPKKGLHYLSLALAGYLLRNGVDVDTVENILVSAWKPHDLIRYDGSGLRQNVWDTAEKLAAGEQVTGGPTLEEDIPGLPQKLAKALGWKSSNMADRSYDRTDLGNAERLVAQHGKLIRWVDKWKSWIVWDGKRWREDSGGALIRKARSTARSIFDDAKHELDSAEQKEIAKWAISSQSRSKIDNMIYLARADLEIRHTELDQNPWLFNVENGTLDLRTGDLRPHDPADMLTKLAPMTYDPEAQAPVFAAFLEQVVPSAALRRFLQRLVGYSLTGVTSDHVLPFLYGTGSNGKTTLITTVMSVLGDYGQQAAPDLLLAKQGAHPTELADLFGARFVASVEVEDGRRFAESLVKQLTGGDKIRARRMREDFWEFDATHKVFLAANHKPVVRGTDHGIWRRIKLIPFTVKIPAAQQDKSLPKKLKAELPGILAWAVRGCSDWQREGLGEPEEVTSATEEYRSEMDVLANFIEDRCVEHEDAHAAAAQLWKVWKSWADISGEKIGTQKAFGARLTERGFESFKYSGGKHKDRRGWAGIGLQTGDDPDPERDDSSDEERTIDRPLADDPPLNRPLQKNTGFAGEPSRGNGQSGRSGPKSDINGANAPHEGGNAEISSALSASSSPEDELGLGKGKTAADDHPLPRPPSGRSNGPLPEDLAAANDKLADPRLVYRDEDAARVISWLRGLTGVALDTETYGIGKRKERRKKLSLSFVRGKIRLIQLSAAGETYFLDAALLSKEAVVSVLEELEGKALYAHNAIFDIPRLKKAYGVDLTRGNVRDTMMLSRLVRSGEWEQNGKGDPVTFEHNIGDALLREIGVEIQNETDHRWGEPLTADRLRYAADDVMYLPRLHDALHDLAAKRGLLDAYALLRKVYPIYMDMQYRGVPFDARLFEEIRGKLAVKLEELLVKLDEHAPEHPEGGTWVWRNNRKANQKEGRNGALRALDLAGTPLPSLQKHVRLEQLKKPGEAPLLEALNQYLKYADLESDTRDWLEFYHENGRLYPNVQFFSQVTGRSAFSEPALQNIPKERDEGLEEVSFRNCIRAADGEQIVKCDYAAQELRVLAKITGDENLLAAFVDQSEGGKDPHIIVAQKIAGQPLERGTPEGEEYRQLGKRANFGFSYGAGWRRYQQSVYEATATPISDKQAKLEKAAFEEAWPQVMEWQQEFGNRDGSEPEHWYTTTALGRRRYVSRNGDGKPNYCDRLNGPIQSGGADMLYLALSRLLDDPVPGAHVIITTHDEIFLEAPTEKAEDAFAWLKGHMKDTLEELLGPELATKDCVEGDWGSSWGGR